MDFNIIKPLVISYGGKLILSLITLIVGLKLIKYVLIAIRKGLEKSSVDKSLYSFIMSAVKITLYVLLVIPIASMVGVEMTSFIAVLGSAGLAIGLALQGSLSNLAGGVLILFLKPFKVGDFIEAAGHSGTIEDIQLFYTILNTPDNKRIFIPNGQVSNSSAVNYSAHATRRVDFKFGVGYEDDILKVKKLLYKVAENHQLVLKDPAPQVVLSEHGDSSVNFSLRLWCKTEDYWKIYFEIMETVKLEFDKEGINIPYPQMDVHLINK